MKIFEIFLFFSLLVVLTACSGNPSPPADFWGGVGFAYEREKASGSTSRHIGPGGTMVVGFEKELGGGLAVGGEAAGRQSTPVYSR